MNTRKKANTAIRKYAQSVRVAGRSRTVRVQGKPLTRRELDGLAEVVAAAEAPTTTDDLRAELERVSPSEEVLRHADREIAIAKAKAKLSRKNRGWANPRGAA